MSDCLIRQHAVISFHWPQSKNTQTWSRHKHTLTHFAGWTGSMLTHTCRYTHTHTVHSDTHTIAGQTSSERWSHWEGSDQLVWNKNYPKKQLHIPEFKLFTELHIKLIKLKLSFSSLSGLIPSLNDVFHHRNLNNCNKTACFVRWHADHFNKDLKATTQ